MDNDGFLSLIPALVTITTALISRRIAWALFFGVASGAFVFADFSPAASISTLFTLLKDAFFDRERLFIALFVIVIGGMLTVIQKSGAYDAFARSLKQFLSTPRRSRVATWLLSLSLFFDDYANVLISGASMKGLLKRHRVSPAVLAYMVDIVAGVASIMLISTWAAYEGSLMKDASHASGGNLSATALFIKSLPYHLYTFFSIFLSFLVAWDGKWFATFLEKPAKTKQKQQADQPQRNGTPKDVYLPVLTLIFVSLGGLFISGWIIVARDNSLAMNLTNILGNAPTIDILLAATVLATVLSFSMLRNRNVLSMQEIVQSFSSGLKSLVPVGMVIILAGALAAVSTKVGTGIFITNQLKGVITPAVLPLMIYIIALLITVATGFSWSSMALVMPVAYQLATGLDLPQFIPVVSGATICGAITGAQLVPYSDKTVMTATACGIDSLYHTKTQLLQVVAATLAAAAGYILIGLNISPVLSFIIPGFILYLSHRFLARPFRDTYSHQDKAHTLSQQKKVVKHGS